MLASLWWVKQIDEHMWCVCGGVVYMLSHVQLFATPWTITFQTPLSMGFPKQEQEYWSWLPFSPPGDLPDPGIEPGSPSLQADFLPLASPAKPCINIYIYIHIYIYTHTHTHTHTYMYLYTANLIFLFLEWCWEQKLLGFLYPNCKWKLSWLTFQQILTAYFLYFEI